MTSLLRRPETVFIMTVIFLSYLWICIFYNHDVIRSIGEFTISFTGFVVSLVWVFQTFYILKKEKVSSGNFWLLLGLGMALYILAWLISAYYLMLLNIDAASLVVDDILWLVAYFLWFFALIYELVKVANKNEIIRILFDIVIFVIVVSELIWEMQLSNIILNLSGNFRTDFVGVAYPVIDLAMLFITFILFYTTGNRDKKTIYTIIAIALIIQTIGDFFYVNQTQSGSYEFGGWVDPVWTLTLLIIGFSGRFRLYGKNSSLMIKKSIVEVKHQDLISIILLSIFLSYHLYRHLVYITFLDITFYFLVVMVFTKYIIVLFQKEKALNRINFLSKNLEKQVKNKTQELQKALSQVEKMALYDQLTGLPNRYMLNKYLLKTIGRGKQMKKSLAILFLDLDRFKYVNDTMGHRSGDLLLRDVSTRLSRSVREGDLIVRFGGDEFIILLEDINKVYVMEVAQRIIGEFVQPFIIMGNKLYITTSIGISLFPDDAENQEDLIASADKAMYIAKERGKNNFQFYSSVKDTVNRKLNLERELRSAIDNNEIYIHYQPQVDIGTNQIVGMEALLRWDNSELGKIRPDEFIPIAEESGLIIPIGRWVLKTACTQLKTFDKSGHSLWTVGVNVSPYQFKDPNFIDDVKHIIHETGIRPELLDIEITENLMQNIEESRIIIDELKKIGVSISIDDFGTGYSSLSLLSSLKIDRIKIDRVFINEMVTNTNTATLVKTIIEMGTNLNTEIVAEGIETEKQALLLKGLNCTIGQGYFYFPPLTIQEMEKLLIKEKELYL